MPETTHVQHTTPSKPCLPCPQPQPARHRVLRARERCAEELAHIAKIRDEISLRPGTKPELRPEWWLDHLRVYVGWLLLALEDEDAARGL